MRFIVKIGTNLLTNEDNSLNTAFVKTITTQVATLHKNGHEPIIVTSGAVASGRKSLKLKKESKHIPYRQVLASVGQTYLLDTYRDDFREHNIVIGQVLVTMGDFNERKNFMSTKKTMELMLELKVIPIINENDVTSFDELKFGDNDNLSAHMASLLGAEKLIILTDVDGLFESNPQKNPDAKLVKIVEKIDDSIKKMAPQEAKGDKGLGGNVQQN